MNILSLENVSKSFSEKRLLQDVNLGMEDDDRIGLVGINGTGKSTLLKLITGQLAPDSGNIARRNNLKIHILQQALVYQPGETVGEFIFQGDHPLMLALRRYEAAAEALALAPDNAGLQAQLLDASATMDALDAWRAEVQARAVLNQLGITALGQRVEELSGGMQKRVALAEALIQPADLLILDEPTNHLDLEVIQWLESYLTQFKAALILVTHDRYFLERVVNKIVEIDRGSLHTYEGNFSIFLEKKAAREEMTQTIEQKKRRLYQQELAWMRQGAQARTTKQKARILRFEALEGQMGRARELELDIPVAYARLGKKVIELQGVGKSYPGAIPLKDFSLNLGGSERIGIVGPNGAGKTTLLNLIARAEKPDAGEVIVGETVRVAYYRQGDDAFDPEQRAIDYIKETAEYVETENGYLLSAGQMLERFMFDGVLQYSLIKNLSGGERRRLFLAKVLMERPNVLLLDEPTNDLDIETLETLEEYLEYFQGSVLVVSHDRYFLDKTTDWLLAVSGDGRVTRHNDLQSYAEAAARGKAKASLSQGVASRIDAEKAETERPERSRRQRFTYQEKVEFATIDDEIVAIEAQLAAIETQIADSSGEYLRLQALLTQQEACSTELAKKMERWTYLHELAEAIEKEKGKE